MTRFRLLLSLVLVAAFGCHQFEFKPKYGEGEIDLYDDLFSVSVSDDGQVVAAGYWGTIYVSSDSGASWEKSDTGTRDLIYSVSIADGGRGWAVGQLATILRTEDGGKTWTKQPNNKQKDAVNLFSVQAIDANTAWAVGEWGTRLFTEDGGISWQDFSLNVTEEHPQFQWLSVPDQERVRKGQAVFEDVTLNDVTCLPPPSRSCWMIGEFGYIFWSDDHGRNWHQSGIEETATIGYLEVAYDQYQLSEEQDAAIRAFSNKIKDETHLNVAIEAFGDAREVQEFGSAHDPTPLFELLEARSQSARAVVEDSGILSDRVRMRGTAPWDYEDFLEDDPEFLNRYLGGRTAEAPGLRLYISQNPFLFTVRFRDESFGLISGLGGIVLQTQDGGRNWTYHKTGRRQALFAVLPLENRSIAVGEKGFIRYSGDGGLSWGVPENGFPSIFTFMRDIRFTSDGRTGYIVGQRGLVLKTEDAGDSWTQVLPPEDRRKG